MNNKYLSEERYQKNKKKLTIIAYIILIIFIFLGASLIVFGITDTNSRKSSNEKRLQEISIEIEQLNKEYDNKETECDSLDKKDSEWFTKVNQCHRESSAIDSKINKLDSEQFNLEHDDNFSHFTIFGIVSLIFGGVIFFMIILIAKGREIKAFQVQQVMPVAQEGINKISPNIGNAAKEIAKGVKEGMKDEK